MGAVYQAGGNSAHSRKRGLSPSPIPARIRQPYNYSTAKVNSLYGQKGTSRLVVRARRNGPWPTGCLTVNGAKCHGPVGSVTVIGRALPSARNGRLPTRPGAPSGMKDSGDGHCYEGDCYGAVAAYEKLNLLNRTMGHVDGEPAMMRHRFEAIVIDRSHGCHQSTIC